MKNLRVKMLCNFTNSKELCDEWKVLCEDGYRWKNIEITWEDTNIDFYVIINYPQKDAFYIPSKTIIFQMEPSCYVMRWGVWANPDPNQFLFVGSHKNHLNNFQVQFKKIPIAIDHMRLDKAMIILGARNHMTGHIKRNNFLRHDKYKLIDIYGKQNYHNLGNYCGSLPRDNKEDMLIKYKYYFMTENNYEYNYATEKIWEPIICECLCFYWGCPNLEDYIDSRAFVRLNVDDIPSSLAIIKKAIEEDWWSQRIEIIRAMKHKILNEHTMFHLINKFI